MMKMSKVEKFGVMILVLILLTSLMCGCAKAVGVVEAEPDEDGVIGYVIVHHSDGDEHADITNCYCSNGIITAYCADGRTIIGTDIILVIN